jgi:hypothetical protein
MGLYGVGPDGQKPGVFPIIIVIVMVLAIASILFLMTLEDPLPPDPLSELEVEVTDVVMADSLWTNRSVPLRIHEGRRYIGIKVSVTNIDDEGIRTNSIPFEVEPEGGTVYEVFYNNVLDPRLEGGPFAEDGGRIRPGQSHEGWICIWVANSSLNWTKAVLRIPTDVVGRTAPTDTFVVTGIRLFKGYASRCSITLNGVTMTDSFTGSNASTGHVLYLFDLTYVNEWPQPRTVPTGGFRLTTGSSWPTFPDEVIWEDVPGYGHEWLEPGESISVMVMFDLSRLATIHQLIYNEEIYSYRDLPEVILPLDDVEIFADFNPRRVVVKVEEVTITDRIGDIWCEEGDVFLVVQAELSNEWTADFIIDRWNLTLVTEDFTIHPALTGFAGLFEDADQRNLYPGNNVTTAFVYQLKEGDAPMYLVYDDHGQRAMDKVDPDEILDARGRTRLVIDVVNMTMVDEVEWPPVREGFKVLLVRLKVSNPWEDQVIWDLDQVTLEDPNGALVDDSPYSGYVEHGIRGHGTLDKGDWIEGWFQIQVPEGWEPGRLMYNDTVIDTVVDLRGREVYIPPFTRAMELEVHWHVLTDHLTTDILMEDHMFFITNLTFHNTGKEPIDLYTGHSNPYAANGSIYLHRAIWFNHQYFPDVILEPGTCVTGMIGFQIPIGEIPAVLEYRYGREVQVAIDPANVTEMDIGTAISLTINDMYWTEEIGNRSASYDDQFLVVNFTVTNGWIEVLRFSAYAFNIVEENGYWNMPSYWADEYVEGWWRPENMTMGASATGLLVYDLFNGSDPVQFTTETAMYNMSVPIDVGDIRNDSGAICMWEPPREGMGGDTSIDLPLATGYHRIARACEYAVTVPRIWVTGPDKN